MQPYEIIGSPYTVWVAAVGTAFPDIDEAPAVDWKKLGTAGNRNYSEEGVTVNHAVSFNKVRPGGATGPVKAFLNEEDLMIRLVLWDMTLEQYSYALNGNMLTTTAAGVGTAGTKEIGLSQGQFVKEYALLVRGVSPYGENMNAQYQVPRCYQSGSPSPVYRKATPAALALEWTALEDLGASSEVERFGTLLMQHALPLGG